MAGHLEIIKFKDENIVQVTGEFESVKEKYEDILRKYNSLIIDEDLVRKDRDNIKKSLNLTIKNMEEVNRARNELEVEYVHMKERVKDHEEEVISKENVLQKYKLEIDEYEKELFSLKRDFEVSSNKIEGLEESI